MSGHYIISLTSLTPNSLSLLLYCLICSSLFHTDSAPSPALFSLRSQLSPVTVPAKDDQTGRRKWGEKEVRMYERRVVATAHRWVKSTRSHMGGNSHFTSHFHLNLNWGAVIKQCHRRISPPMLC